MWIFIAGAFAASIGGAIVASNAHTAADNASVNASKAWGLLMTPPVVVKRDAGSAGGAAGHAAREASPSYLDVIYNELRGLVSGQTAPKVMCGNQAIDANSECFDVIIVGGGGAGATAAKKISDDNLYSVLLLEAGQDEYEKSVPNTIDPMLRFGTPECMADSYKSIKLSCGDPSKKRYWWPGRTVSQPGFPLSSGSPIGQNSEVDYANGRVLGGGTSINGFQVVRGDAAYWNEVSATSGGHAVWGSANIFNVMKQQESFNAQGHFTPSSSRGATGLWSNTVRPVNASADLNLFAQTMAFAMNAGELLPDPTLINDYNDPATPIGMFERWQMQEKHETPNFDRETSDQAFLGPTVLSRTTYLGQSGRKLSVRTGKTVKSLLWDAVNTTRCVGVEYIENVNGIQKIFYAWARKTVVLATNIHTPTLLQQNGIGPVATLTAAGVPIRVASENVGRNLKTHLGAIMIGLTATGKADLPAEFGGAQVDYAPGNTYGLGGGAFTMDVSKPEQTKRGFQWIFLPLFPFDETITAFIAVPFHLTPVSNGTLDIQTPDPEHQPLVDLKLLSEYEDKVSFQRAIKGMVEGNGFFNFGNTFYLSFLTDVFASFNETVPPFLQNGFDAVDLENPESVAEFVRANYVTAHHWVGAARIGTSISNGVVDWRLRVFGTTGLRVCDTMVLPEVPTGNTATPAVAIGDICGTLIREDIA